MLTTSFSEITAFATLAPDIGADICKESTVEIGLETVNSEVPRASLLLEDFYIHELKQQLQHSYFKIQSTHTL